MLFELPKSKQTIIIPNYSSIIAQLSNEQLVEVLEPIKGRRLKPENLNVRLCIAEHLKSMGRDERFTTLEVVDSIGVNVLGSAYSGIVGTMNKATSTLRLAVMNTMLALEKKGLIGEVGERISTGHAGPNQVVWRLL